MCKLFRTFFSNNIDEHIPCEYLMSIWPFDHIEKKKLYIPEKIASKSFANLYVDMQKIIMILHGKKCYR